ncbi:hypothetical protein [Brevibacillus brevis]|uniref:hypothetical protein n=1 Tax=Brevibacillus brevis TaxID=1393 RepID=UPI0031B8A390
MSQYVDSATGEIYYTEEVLLRSDEIVKIFRPVGRSTKFVKIKASQKAKRRLRKLSLAKAGFLLKIAPYASEGTNLLQGDNERGQKGTPLTVKDLTRIVSKINPASYNPRIDLQPGDIEYEKLKRSFQEFGYVEPLILD